MAREARGGLGFGDRLVLLVAWVTTCGLVYLLGFYVGKGTQARQLGMEERVVRLPVTSQPPPEGTRPKGDQFVFYDKLMGDRAGGARTAAPAGESGPRTATAPAAVSAAPPAAKPVASVEAKSAAAKPVVAVERKVAPIGVPPSTTATPSAAKPATPPRPVSTPERVPAPPALPPAQPPAPAVARVPSAPSPSAAPPVTPPAVGAWTVLANPTRSREDADTLLRQLRGRGYEATLVRVVRDGDTWYRVQVGRFPTAEQATEVMHRLREHEGVPHAFVASE